MVEQQKGSPEKDAKHASDPQHGSGAPSAEGVKPPAPIGGPTPEELPEGARAVGVDPGPVAVQYGEQGNTVEYTLTDAILNVRAEMDGQELPYPDLPKEAMYQVKQMGLVPVGTGDVGKVLRPDQAPGEIRHLGHMTNPAAPLTPTQAVEKFGPGDTMIFPSPVQLTADDHSRIHYPAGTHEVPARFVEHSYLKASGVQRHAPSQTREPMPSVQEGKERIAQRKP